MVAMVTTEKSSETSITPLILFSAAGYISMGISGSHGPRTKMRNRIHGVMFFLFFQMDMRVTAEMVMLMFMISAVSMVMRMNVLSFAVERTEADKHVNKTEGYQKPGCNVPPE